MVFCTIPLLQAGASSSLLKTFGAQLQRKRLELQPDTPDVGRDGIMFTTEPYDTGCLQVSPRLYIYIVLY